MNSELAFWLAVFGLVWTCLAAIGAKSLAEFSRSDLEENCRRRKSPERLGTILRRYEHVALAAETLQVVATVLFLAAAGAWAAPELFATAVPSAATVLWMFVFGGLALLALAIWVPWAIVHLWATPFVYYTWPFWEGVYWLLWPLVLGARFVDALLHRLAGRLPEEPDEESFGEEIRTIVTEGHREGLLEEDARKMIDRVVHLGDVQVSEIMTPRTDMISLPLARDWDEVIAFAVQSEHTRIPVYNKTRDDIVGILHIKDLLAELAKPPAQRVQPWPKLLHEAYFVPETKPVDVLLQEFQRARQHIAVVLDEYGGVAGLVSMEDVLEEIVGEIVDEYDEALVEGIRELGEGVAEALGRVRIDEINRRLGLELPDDGDFDTIGGFVFSELGHVPVVGEELLWRNVRITVVEATARRVERLRIEILDRPPVEGNLMSTEKGVAIVLRSVPFSESSLVLTLLTREFGKIRALAKGGRRLKGPFESALDLLAQCRIVFLRKSSEALDLLTEAKLLRFFRPAGRDLSSLYGGYYVAELLDELTDDYDPHPELFDLADETLQALSTGEPVAKRLLRFELLALRFLGHLPALDVCAECGRAVEPAGRVAFGQLSGGVLCPECRGRQKQVALVSGAALRTMAQLADPQRQGWRRMEIEPRTYGEIRGLMNRYLAGLLGKKPRLHKYLASIAEK